MRIARRFKLSNRCCLFRKFLISYQPRLWFYVSNALAYNSPAYVLIYSEGWKSNNKWRKQRLICKHEFDKQQLSDSKKFKVRFETVIEQGFCNAAEFSWWSCEVIAFIRSVEHINGQATILVFFCAVDMNVDVFRKDRWKSLWICSVIALQSMK